MGVFLNGYGFLSENVGPVVEEPEGKGQNARNHRIVVNNDKLFAFVQFFKVRKGPQFRVGNVDGVFHVLFFVFVGRPEVNQDRISQGLDLIKSDAPFGRVVLVREHDVLKKFGIGIN